MDRHHLPVTAPVDPTCPVKTVVLPPSTFITTIPHIDVLSVFTLDFRTQLGIVVVDHQLQKLYCYDDFCKELGFIVLINSLVLCLAFIFRLISLEIGLLQSLCLSIYLEWKKIKHSHYRNTEPN